MEGLGTSRKLVEALLYAEMEPWNVNPVDFWLERLTVLVANVCRNRDENPEPFERKDIVPDPDLQPDDEEIEEMLRAKIKGLGQALRDYGHG